MTVEKINPVQTFTANGSTTAFTFQFVVEDKANIAVKVNSLEISVDEYAYDANTNSIIFEVAPVAGSEVEVRRVTDLERSIQYETYNNSFRPETLNYDLDRIWHVLQEANITDVEILARIKNEIEWRRTHDINYDELAQVREKQLFDALKGYTDTLVASTNPNIFQGVIAGVVFAQDGKSVQTHLSDIATNFELSRLSILEESNRAITAESLLSSKIDSEKNRALNAEANLQLQISTANAGIKYFETETALLAYTPTLESDAKQAYAFDTKKNYLWIATTSTWKDEGKTAVDQAIEILCEINQLLPTKSIKQDTTFYYNNGNGKVTKDSNPELFAIETNTQEGEYFILNTQSFGVVGAYYIVNSNNDIIEKMESIETSPVPYLIKIPNGGTKLFVNCVYNYASSFSFTKISSGVLELMYKGINRQQNTYYVSLDGTPVAKTQNQALFAVELSVTEGDVFLVDTKTFGIAGEYYVTDSGNNVLSYMTSSEGTDAPYIVKVPKLGTKLYVNCAYTYQDTFYVRKLADSLLKLLTTSGLRQDYVFFYSADGTTIKREKNTGLFAVEIDVDENQYYSIETKTFGIAVEYCVADGDGKLLEKKASNGLANGEYIIQMPVTAKKLYVNCAYNYKNNFNVTRVSRTLVEKTNEVDTSVITTFPTFNYFNKLQEKCPNFYQKFKDKNKDVTVVLTGTSLTQGNLYTSDRTDATTRPAALHTKDLASSVFDKLIKHWDGQKYRRYDHGDLVYSASNWSVLNTMDNGVWDDYAHIKNGLTKTTTGANASVSMTIPSTAWQFNFVYRSDSQSGSCVVTIAEGNSKVEVWNGTSWVEANGHNFTMYESPATATKGNTLYQKRLKMRCKNKASDGINSIGSTKQITISKGDNSDRFNVVGFEWSQREFMLSVINGARGGFEWGDPNGNRLDRYQDTDIWSFNPDLLLAEITIINWGASEPAALTVDPLHYVNIAKRAYFNEFNDTPTSLHAKSEGYTKCDVIFYSDTPAASSAVSNAWDSATHEPKFGTVTTAATNGAVVDNTNIGRVKTNFENYEAVERYISSKNYLFIPVLSTFKAVSEKYYGSYWAGMQPSGKIGNTLSIDGVHFNDNGAALFGRLISTIFENI